MVSSESDPSSIAALATSSLRFNPKPRAPSNMSVLDASSILVPWLTQPPRTCFRRRSLLCGPRCLPTRPSCVMQAIIGPDSLRPMLPSDLLDPATSAPRVLSPTAPSTSETVRQAPDDPSAPSPFADDPGLATPNSCPCNASPAIGNSLIETPNPPWTNYTVEVASLPPEISCPALARPVSEMFTAYVPYVLLLTYRLLSSRLSHPAIATDVALPMADAYEELDLASGRSPIQRIQTRYRGRPVPPAEKMDLDAPSNPEIWKTQVSVYMRQSGLWDVIHRAPITREIISKAVEGQGLTITSDGLDHMLEEALADDAHENLEAHDLLYTTLKFAKGDASAREALRASSGDGRLLWAYVLKCIDGDSDITEWKLKSRLRELKIDINSSPTEVLAYITDFYDIFVQIPTNSLLYPKEVMLEITQSLIAADRSIASISASYRPRLKKERASWLQSGTPPQTSALEDFDELKRSLTELILFSGGSAASMAHAAPAA